MKLIVTLSRLVIEAETPQDEVFIRKVLGLREAGDTILLRKQDSAITFLETWKEEKP